MPFFLSSDASQKDLLSINLIAVINNLGKNVPPLRLLS